MRSKGKRTSGIAEKADTKTKLIEAYLKISEREGVAAVTYEKVAKQAGVAFGTARYHFAGTDQDLVTAAVRHVFAEGLRVVEGHLGRERTKSGFRPLESYVRANFLWIENRRHTHFIPYFYYLSALAQPVLRESENYVNEGRTRVLALLHEGIGSGVYPRVRQPQLLANQIHQVVFGAIVGSLTSNSAKFVKQEERLANASIQSLVEAAALREK